MDNCCHCISIRCIQDFITQSVDHRDKQSHAELEGKYSLESTDTRESEIRASPQPLPYFMPIPPNTLFYNKKIITAFLSLGLGNTS